MCFETRICVVWPPPTSSFRNDLILCVRQRAKRMHHLFIVIVCIAQVETERNAIDWKTAAVPQRVYVQLHGDYCVALSKSDSNLYYFIGTHYYLCEYFIYTASE